MRFVPRRHSLTLFDSRIVGTFEGIELSEIVFLRANAGHRRALVPSTPRERKCFLMWVSSDAQK